MAPLRKIRWPEWLLAFVLSLVLAGCSGGPTTDSSEQKPPAAPMAPSAPEQAVPTVGGSAKEPGGAVKTIAGVVTSVADGDTMHVKLDGRDETVRLIGVNCPEISHPDLGIKEEPYGREARAYTEKQLSGKKVWLEFDVQERDKYGRLLAYVWLEPPSSGFGEEVRAKMYNVRLLLEGYAQVMTVPPNVKYADMFVEFQREAREKGKGLWGVTPMPALDGAAEKQGGTLYIGNSRSKVFHLPTCEWAQKIAPQNRVEFGSREEAIKAGYRPCKVCGRR
ncbi:thermonuclease family protein [Moorellaceae bacterium AZ2]